MLGCIGARRTVEAEASCDLTPRPSRSRARAECLAFVRRRAPLGVNVSHLGMDGRRDKRKRIAAWTAFVAGVVGAWAFAEFGLNLKYWVEGQLAFAMANFLFGLWASAVTDFKPLAIAIAAAAWIVAQWRLLQFLLLVTLMRM